MSTNNTYIVLLCLVVILIFYTWYLKPYCDQVNVQTFTSTHPGPTVLFIGSVHGNEPAGTLALESYFRKKIHMNRGKIIVVTRPNRCGQALNIRWQPQYFPLPQSDLNRSFYPSTINQAANTIMKYIQEANIIVDLHEGWGFHQYQPDSMGSCVYPSPKLKWLAEKCVQNINRTIANKKKHFLVRSIPLLHGTTDEYTLTQTDDTKHTLMLETTGHNDIQPIGLRVQQQQIFIDTILKELKLIK